MISFESDYTTGAHPRLLQRLAETNMEVLSGYGKDIYCETARKKIQEMCACPDADVFFLIGGTQTNAVVIAAKTGHVSLHEAGAIEITGHKVLELSQVDGKLEASVIKQFLEQFYKDENHEHMVFPGMVYVSYPTEYGTLYTKKELTDISKVCKEYEVPLFLDGARLGYGLMSREADLSLEDIAELCDVFYIGGTKVGALCGEAVVFTKNNMPKHFVNHVKRHGALMAKGRLLGVQFDALFTDGLYFEISKNAIDMAEKMKDIFKEKGYRFYMESPTNQQFFIIENERLEKLKEKVRFGFWEKYDETHTVVRFASSWSTTEEDLKQLREIL